MQRRDFIYQGSILTTAAFTGLSPLTGGFANEPGDKNTGKSIEKGKPTTYLKSKNELNYIGMPVGGILCGMLYLGGDGRLWLWDLFNKNQTGVIYKDIPWHEKIQGNDAILRPFDGANYVQPVKDIRPVEQGFALCFDFSGNKMIKRLQQEDWDEIAFEATYPMATIHYSSKDLPAVVRVKVYSPFIPLDEENSGLPATIYSFHIQNNSEQPMVVSVAGWLENKSCIYTAVDEQYTRNNKAETKNAWSAVTFGTHNKNWADDNFYIKPDYGNFCLASYNDGTLVNTSAQADPFSGALFSAENKLDATAPYNNSLYGSVCNKISLQPGQSSELNYCISWYFPNLSFRALQQESQRYYANKFNSAAAVNEFVFSHFDHLSSLTQLWMDTYYHHSTLPYWFLERTFLNISTLATTTCHRFSSGRFYAWEGVGSCAGTCNHVWQYAQAVARIFPALERDTRERVDLGIALHEDGHIGFRGEYDEQPAMDGQAGRILGVYREHRTAVDASFLQRVWPRTKKAISYLLKQDRNGNGMVDTQLENTLDAKWPGEIAWLVGLCLTAIKAGQLMAEEMGDPEFANTCKSFFDKGKANMEELLFNGEYFIHRPDPVIGKTVLGSYNTCHIDQVYGQSWAFQAGIDERIIDPQKTLSALRALWKYNFMTDVGPYLQTHHGGRPYALPGEGGMLMNTNPKNDPLPYGVQDAWQATYFHECMSGFEHQVASHMMAEGMTDESLQLTRAIHDRYHASKRNPFNEVECSDHYARAMASYGTYITACGFEYHGPAGFMAFSPKINAGEFSGAFTAAAGWGLFTQKKLKKGWSYRLDLRYGSLELKTIRLHSGSQKIKSVTCSLQGEKLPVSFTTMEGRTHIEFDKRLNITIAQKLEISLS